MASDKDKNVNLYALIMAGGRGTRFWPASAKNRPKQLMKLGEKSLLRLTYERIAPLFPKKNVFVFVSHEIVDDVKRELPELPIKNVISEPTPKNTAPCIALCAQMIFARDPNGVMAVFPSDHYIKETNKFRKIILAAIDFAKKADALMTFGIKPRYPSTGYGYLHFGECVDKKMGVEIFRLEKFEEKPSQKKSKEFVRSRKYFWNSGIFVWRTSAILDRLGKFLPRTFEVSRKIARSNNFESSLKKSFKSMDAISIDYGVMERSDNVYSIAADITWSDLGSWEAFYEVAKKDERDNAVCGGELVAVDANRLLVYTQDKLVAAIGVSDLAIVATDRAILVCPKKKSQRVREIVSILEGRKRTDLL